MKASYSIIAAVMFVFSGFAYENDGPGCDPNASPKARLMKSSDSFSPPEPSDICFVVTEGGDIGKTKGQGETITIPLDIPRYFGNKNKLLKSGALSERAVLTMIVYDVDSKYPSNPEVDKVYLNGKKYLGTMWGDNEVYYQNQFIINTKDLNLAEFLGGTGHNTIEIKVDVNNGGWITHVKWISLYIPAAPPVVLAHGINSHGGQLAKLAKEIEDETGLPTLYQWNFGNSGNNHIDNFSELGAIIQSYKKTCHVDHVNIVGHSMGGLRARGYAENATDVFKVLQVGTPNGGSPIADFVVRWKMSVNRDLLRMKDNGIISQDQYNQYIGRARNAISGIAHDIAGMNLDPWGDPAVVCLQTSEMREYNNKHEFNSEVDYGVVAGKVTKHSTTTKLASWLVSRKRETVENIIEEILSKYTDGDYTLQDTLAAFLAQQLDTSFLQRPGGLLDNIFEAGDLIVPVYSAHTKVTPLGGSPLEGKQSEVWHSGLVSDGVERVVKCLKPKLVEQKMVAKGTKNSSAAKSQSNSVRKTVGTLSLAQAAEGASDSVVNDIQTGVAFSGKSANASFDIVQGHHAMVVLDISTDDIMSTSLRLKAPSGKVYDDCAQNVLMTNGISDVVVMLANPETGKWTLEWTSEFSNPADVGIWTLAAFEVDDGVVFSPKLVNTSVAVGTTFALTVSPKVGDSTVSGIVKVVATAPNGTSAVYNATRDASGVFSAQIPATVEGHYTFAVKLDATSPSAFSRSSIISGVAHSGGAGFLQSHSAVVPDVDGNGLYDNLTVNFAVNTTKAGTYRVLATLADTDGNEITEGWTSNIVCSAGTRTFPVAFDGRAIYGHGECGGYKVSSARLLEIGEGYEAVVDERSDLFTTTAYTYRQFEHDLVTMKSGGSDSAVDVNGDGTYDRLDVTIPLYADDLAAGSYGWSASLMDADGFLLGTASGDVTFVSGQGGASISMSFDRDGIVATHKNGRYYVKNLILWGNGRNLTISGEYITSSYNIEDFGGELATVDLGFILPLGWTDSLVISTNATGTTCQTFFEQGDPIYLNYAFANVTNQAAVSNFVNRFTLSNGNDYSDSWIGHSLGEGKWGWLGEGFAPTMLQNLPAGTYTLTCELDADGQLPETDEFNNVMDVTFTINESLRPNLELSVASVSRTSFSLSESAVFHWRVENTGRAAAKKTKTSFETWKYDSSANKWIRKKTEWLDCIPLAAGGGREFTRTISGKTFGVGEFAILVSADGNSSLMELDESDNDAIVFYTVVKDNATRSTSGVDWQFRKKASSEPDSFYLSTSANAKKKATTFKVGQTIYLRCCWWNATKKAASGNMRVSLLLNGRQEGYTDRSNFNKSSWYYLTDRTPSFLQNLPAGKYTLTAVLDSENNFVEKNEKNNVRQISFTVVGAPTIYGEESFTCALNESVNWPISSEGSMTVKGLPPGMKYSGGAIVGKATKLGTFSAKFTAKNAAGTRTKTVKIVVINPGFDVSVNVRANGATDAVSVSAGETVPMFVGVVQNISVASTPGKDGIAKSGASSVTAAGLPPGLKYSKGVISGVPSKAGTYTVKLTFKNALGWSKTFTMKMKVTSLPAFARGTFNGWSYESDYYKRKVTVSVTTAGKITAKVGTLSFSRTGWTIDDFYGYFYVATMRTVRTTGTGKKKKTYTDVLRLTLGPGAAWTEDQLTGTVATFNGTVKLADALEAIDTWEEGGTQALVDAGTLPMPVNVDQWVSARRNSFGDNADAKALAAELVALGTQTLTDDDGLVWNLKVASNGVATIARTTGAGKNKKTVSATAVVAWDGGEYGPYAVFLVDGKIVEVRW